MKIAIVGYGVEGKSVLNYVLKTYPDADISIYDERQVIGELPGNIAVIVGTTAFIDVDADIVFRSPGIAPNKISTKGDITSATKEFLEKCPAPIIGVTGTKGKGTTASLIHSILQASGKKSWLVGNIGTPALDVLDQITPDDIVVYELSSFQLWDLEQSPHTAVVLMIEPDHLDVHADFAEYVNAKANITKHQTADDVLVYAKANDTSSHIAIQSEAAKRPFQDDALAHVDDGWFYFGETKLCQTEALKLPGEHNLDNACAAINAVWEYVQDGGTIASGLAAFGGLPHRLKFVREVDGVSYYDDSIATTPGSAIAALRAFEQPKVLILGGSDKGVEYTELIDAVLGSSSMRAVLCIGAIGPQLHEAFIDKGAKGGLNLVSETDMKMIVEKAKACAQPGDVVIMSPAAASFDMFKNYADRGEQFVAAVNQL